MKLVAIDFDGVIHHYTEWDGEKPRGRPVLGIRKGLTRLKAAGYQMECFTARSKMLPVQEWLKFYGLAGFFERITNTKSPGALAFFDDRAWRVERNAIDGLDDQVKNFLDEESVRDPMPRKVVQNLEAFKS